MSSPGPTSPTLRVMAIDDDADMLEVIRLALGRQYEVLTLSNPMDTYELVELFEPDLLILDVMMPKVTGFQLLDILHRSPRTRNLPVIILSAKAAKTDILQGYQLGAALYLAKPLDPERLLKNVRTHFETREGGPSQKTLPMAAVRMQFGLKRSFKSGTAQLCGPSSPPAAAGSPK